MSDSMDKDLKISGIVKKLHQNTLSGEIEWGKSVTKGIYQVEISGYVIRLHRTEENARQIEGETAAPIYNLMIYNMGDNDLIEKAVLSGSSRSSGGPNIVAELYKAAEKQAMGVHKALDAILKGLG